jgi:flagellar basal body-associated protein FliL
VPPSTGAEVRSHGFRKVVLVVVAVAAVGAGAWALRMHYDSDEQQDMKSFCEAVTAAVQATGTNTHSTLAGPRRQVLDARPRSPAVRKFPASATGWRPRA